MAGYSCVVASMGDLKLETLLGVLVVMLYPLRTPVVSGLKAGLMMPSLSLSLDLLLIIIIISSFTFTSSLEARTHLSCSSCCLILLERFLTTGRPVTVAALHVD